ncbi:MAG: hypothetical protein COU08_01335 [Candidatus Harrisonbacteria bacterium CG10_big_fil_rev_8_21_14_0_10_42_17]|uniref:Purine nucleoside phosphorylase n=1 Tax=Candidatus Harrisonbacteria bacterium CG10_big_fil_rev_8_21_14_0_10_42_17 TaxID=1974584 RepID=A0A2M6WIJ2_9BACT|nr:MAG: hypothetical protein COU08_01335 [Candidatus Harrisonbacteria bacterium CG10_big_fil_rev_8_21_14_0_10_42_17]
MLRTALRYHDLMIAREGVAHFRRETFSPPHGFSTLSMGNMSFRFREPSNGFDDTDPFRNVAENRRSVFAFLGLNSVYVVVMKPQHGTTIVEVNGESVCDTPPGDVLVTTTPGLALAICPADCIPIFLTDSFQSFLALVHAGRVGTESRVLEKTILFLIEKGFIRDASDLLPMFGPSIRRCCYAVDLFEENVNVLLERGVSSNNIVAPQSTLCTYCSRLISGEHSFFSHRRSSDSSGSEPQGRFLAVAALPPMS